MGFEVSSSGGSLGGLIISLTPWMMPLYHGSSMDVGTNNFRSSGGVPPPGFTGFSGSCSDTFALFGPKCGSVVLTFKAGQGFQFLELLVATPSPVLSLTYGKRQATRQIALSTHRLWFLELKEIS